MSDTGNALTIISSKSFTSVPLRLHIYSLTLPKWQYKYVNPRILKVMQYKSENSVAYFKLYVTLYLTNSPSSLYQTIECYGRIKTRDMSSLTVKFLECIEFSAKISDLGLDSYIVIRLVEGKVTNSEEGFGNRVSIHAPHSLASRPGDSESTSRFVGLHPLTIQENCCAEFRTNIFDKSTGFMLVNTIRSTYGNVKKGVEDSIHKEAPSPHPWLDIKTYARINNRSHKSPQEFNLEDIVSNPSHHKGGPYILYIQFSSVGHNIRIKYLKKEILKLENHGPKNNMTPADSPFLNRETPIYSNLNEVEDNPCEEMILKSQPIEDSIHIVPTVEQKKEIKAIVTSTIFDPLPDAKKAFLWRFRYYLKDHEHRALPKLLDCVSWDSPNPEIFTILKEWNFKDWIPEECLILLSSRFRNAEVRKCAVKVMNRFKDEDILGILLQLVQALRYEPNPMESVLTKMLLRRALSSFAVANDLFWYLSVEKNTAPYSSILHLLTQSLSEKKENFSSIIFKQVVVMNSLEKIAERISLISQDKQKAKVREMLSDWRTFGDEKTFSSLFDPPLPLPIDPQVLVTGIIGEEASVFSSNARPILIPFRTVNGGVYKVIYKTGDDLRKDQFVLQIIRYIGRVTSTAHYEAHLSPYRVLATSQNTGLVEFVPNSEPLGALEKKKISIQEYLKDKRIDSEKVQQIYIRSLGGYTIISYLLGFGDRHPENILLQKGGKLFHIDFGYIFGDQPRILKGIVNPTKMFSGPIKLSPYMIDGLGGGKARNEFLSFSLSYFKYVRKHAHPIINQLYLMVDSGILGISDSTPPVQQILFVVDNLWLDLDEEKAIQKVNQSIKKAEKSFGGIVEDLAHGIAHW